MSLGLVEPVKKCIPRDIFIFGTGQKIPNSFGSKEFKFISTVMAGAIVEGDLVWHIFEAVKP